jgi:hypothetical protein
VQELAAHPLKLPIDRQLSLVQRKVIPGETEYLTLAEAEHEDQDVGGVERVMVGLGRLQESARFVARPRFAFARSFA